jgi:hypothetical protein
MAEGDPYVWPYDFPPHASLLVWSCRSGTVHEPHDYWGRQARSETLGPMHCPGIEHDHDKLCCTEHNHHTTPHRG